MSEQQKQIAKILEQIAIRESADADQLLSALRDEEGSELNLKHLLQDDGKRSVIELAGLKLAYLLVSSSKAQQVAQKVKEGALET